MTDPTQANIGASFARDWRITPEKEAEDIRGIGYVMMELMEPTSFILHPQSTQLKDPTRWRDGSGIKEFLLATRYAGLEDLKNVSHHHRKTKFHAEG